MMPTKTADKKSDLSGNTGIYGQKLAASPRIFGHVKAAVIFYILHFFNIFA